MSPRRRRRRPSDTERIYMDEYREAAAHTDAETRAAALLRLQYKLGREAFGVIAQMAETYEDADA